MGASGPRIMKAQLLLGGLSLVAANSTITSPFPGEASFVAPPGFPTSVFSSYYVLPTRPTQEPQPIIDDPVLHKTYPFSLTNPDAIPTENHNPVVYPEPRANLTDQEQQALIQDVKANVTRIIQADATADSCGTCREALAAAQPAAWYAPLLVPHAMISLCTELNFESKDKCEEDYAPAAFGAVWTQVLSLADVNGLDGNYICHALNKTFCARPTTSPLDTTDLFPKPKPANPRVPSASGKRVKVLHLSDFHLDPRYSVGSEADCSSESGMCCRTNLHNAVSPNQVLLPASPYGAFLCDTPYDLGLAALEAIGPLTGTRKSKEGFGFSIYTGDMVSHDSPISQIDRDYVQYTETSIFRMLKSYISGPVYAALGNHDTSPENIESPHKLPGPLGEQQSWHYDHVAGLWQHEGWLNGEAAEEARTQYGGYSTKTPQGLRIISFNTDFWYKNNYLNLINTANPDHSGVFAWMIDELQQAEDNGERVWIIGHVLSGWDGTSPHANPSDLFYQIVDRYSPHVIANVFFGHSHEDQFMVYYANNGTTQTADTAITSGWIGPSITPLENLNSGFRMYEVDTGNFEIYEAYTFFSNVSDFPSLSDTGPVFHFEYSAREAYGEPAKWDADAPLNATFWHRVTEAMEKDGELVSLHNTLQGKSSVKSPECTSAECRAAKICYMRSGSMALGSQCPQGYGSVQKAFGPTQGLP